MSDIHKLGGGSHGTPAAREQRRPIERREIVRALLAMFLGAVVSGILTAMALVLLVVTDACGPGMNDCNTSLFTAGFFFALLLPPFAAVVGFVWSAVVLQRRRRRAWRVPLVALAASVLLWLVGAVLCFASVPGYGVGDYLGVLGTVLG